MITFILLFSILSPLHGQNSDILLNRAVQFFPDEQLRSTGEIHIIAAMVDFQRDDNDFTSGDGSFHLSYLERDDIIIDPLPHDRNYFEAHLEFVQNYFERVSNNQLSVSFEVLPNIYTLDEEMAAYAPLGEDGAENFKLANLSAESWEKVVASGDLDLAGRDMDNTMFIVFHAGAGRDIELLGTTLNKTPQDIPSVYLGESSLRRLLDQPDFQGFPTARPDFFIRNTAILPQTQSRAGQDILGEEIVLELSINGILTATVGSFLGLPDLFNTETGQAGIGRFGLMDGASIFSYLGTFPPEPSAWEKMYLGWAEPFDIDLDSDQPISLPAVSEQRTQQIARHNISKDEYFLVENRHRDPDGNGVVVTIQKPDGSREDFTISAGDERFNPFNSSEYDEILAPGTVVNVSNFDFSLPGGPTVIATDDPDEDEDRLLNGGMLIWHIDDAVIRRTIDNNRINANSDRRGVRVVEADGAQQIGKPEFGLETGRYINGHAFDFWWSGNDFTVINARGNEIQVYENRFGPDTQPDNRSNSGSPSYFEFYDFSDNVPNASFYARRITPDFAQPHFLHGRTIDNQLFYNSLENRAYPLGIMAFTPAQSDSVLLFPSQSGFEILNYSRSEANSSTLDLPPTGMPFNDEILVIPSNKDDEYRLHAFESNDSPNGNPLSEIWTTNELDMAPPGFLSVNRRDTLEIDFTTKRVDLSNGNFFPDYQSPRQYSAPGSINSLFDDQELIIRRPDGRFSGYRIEYEQSDRLYTGIISGESSQRIYIILDEIIFLYNMDEKGQTINNVINVGSQINWPAMIDFTQDGSIDFIFVDRDRNQLNGINQNGANLQNFPLQAPRGKRFTGTPLIADIYGNGTQEILIAAQDSLSITIHAFDENLSPVQGFPLFVGSVENEDFDPVHPILFGNELIAVSHIGEISAWSFEDMGKIMWTSQYGAFVNGKVSSSQITSDAPTRTFSLLNAEETYNWPNPARDHTYIRFETRERAMMHITMIDMSGSKIRDYQFESRGNQPEEIRIATNDLSSGVYYARVQARAGGNTESELIKIVVIR